MPIRFEDSESSVFTAHEKTLSVVAELQSVDTPRPNRELLFAVVHFQSQFGQEFPGLRIPHFDGVAFRSPRPNGFRPGAGGDLMEGRCDGDMGSIGLTPSKLSRSRVAHDERV